jgi:hypothetical protein
MLGLTRYDVNVDLGEPTSSGVPPEVGPRSGRSGRLRLIGAAGGRSLLRRQGRLPEEPSPIDCDCAVR